MAWNVMQCMYLLDPKVCKKIKPSGLVSEVLGHSIAFCGVQFLAPRTCGWYMSLCNQAKELRPDSIAIIYIYIYAYTFPEILGVGTANSE